MADVMGMKMWTRSAQPVDKPMLYTLRRTTPLQDVSLNGVSCDHEIQLTIGRKQQFPQSTALITVIRSIYIHPHIAITTSHNSAMEHPYEIQS